MCLPRCFLQGAKKADCEIRSLIFSIHNGKVRWDLNIMSQNDAAIILNPFPEMEGLQIWVSRSHLCSQPIHWMTTDSYSDAETGGQRWMDRYTTAYADVPIDKLLLTTGEHFGLIGGNVSHVGH